MENNLIAKAAEFARKEHAHISFKIITGYERPQIEHLQEVADLVWLSGGTDEEITAAWLHDTVEDTSATSDDIRALFGAAVASLVDELTDPEEIKHLPTKERKAVQAERIKNESESARKIKLADQTSNVKCVAFGPKAEWTLEGRRNYALGAKKIADQCKGLNMLLDELFDREYAKAQEVLGITEDTPHTLERLDATI